jgi:hypothetical protein
MTTEPSHDSRPSLDEQLRAAESGETGGARLARSADRAGARYAAVMATLVALYLLVVVYVYPRDILWLDLLATAVFVAGLVGTCIGYGRRRQASGLGWSKRYSYGFALSTLLFGLGLVLMDLTDSRAAWLWVPYAAVTALPLLAAMPDGPFRGFRGSEERKTP